ncbi:hypothetical protein BCR39DRAFT_531991 [Naematelia encephala]|uniref:NAD(P)-binding protein n=1 Tax=Naematelia encephala TaxID=71784 RepID=A0A1Y2B3Y0_9TREE|nr:hypothetical protein BCR39DRAFT_531991 [Naematelia encephala]
MLDVSLPELQAHFENLKDAIILITGGAAGFGRATAVTAARHGSKVVIADISSKAISSTIKLMTDEGLQCCAPPNPTDVTKAESLRTAFEICMTTYGRPPDIVFANAGVTRDDWFEDELEVAATKTQPAHPREPRDKTIAVNLDGALRTAEMAREYWAASPLKQGQKKRRLVIMSSMGGQTAIPGAAFYSTSKHALLGYCKGLWADLEPQGDKAEYEVHVICPFFANTSLQRREALLVLAGFPLVPVDLVVNSMLFVASKPTSTSPGTVILLPDDNVPAMAEWNEYNPLSLEWSHKMDARSTRYSTWTKVNGFRRFWKDVARNYFGISEVKLSLVTFLAIFTVGILSKGIAKGISTLPVWSTMTTGALLGLITSVRRGNKTKLKTKSARP